MIEPELYYRLFQLDPMGKQVFEDICAFHYDIDCFDENPYKMAHNEGRRAVVRWIMLKLALSQRPDTDTTIIEE